MKKILVPCDFSDSAKQAYKFAVDIASANSGEIFVVKVIDLTPVFADSLDTSPYYLHITSILKDLEETAWNDFEAMMKDIDAKNVKVTFVVEQGTVCQTLLKQIHKHEADLVIMGTHGVNGIKEFLVGSNAEKIVQCAPVPVFVTHHAQDITYIKNIIFPTQIDLNQTRLFEKIKVLQAFFNAKLHLLYIKTTEKSIPNEELETSLRNLAVFYNLSDYTINVRRYHNEEDGISQFAR